MTEFDNGSDDDLPAAPRTDVLTFLSARRGQYLADHSRLQDDLPDRDSA
jgi:hypothetical protein